MNVVGLMLVRNEDWVISASIDAALKWCDGLAVYVDRSSDRTYEIVDAALRKDGRDHYLHYERTPEEHWTEMFKRQDLLDRARRSLSPTHCAMIDADEILTANNVPNVRHWISELREGQVLDVPMVPVWGDLDHYRNDASVWSRSTLSVAFSDRPGMAWMPRGGYHFHNRVPQGASPERKTVRCDGGVMHLQFANKSRLAQKHLWYWINERVRWPEKHTPRQLNEIYGQALDERGIRFDPVPPEWWGDVRKADIDISPRDHYYLGEIRTYVAAHGIEILRGMNLHGAESMLLGEETRT